jgi:type II secretory pathway pseudopilin PulG
MKPARVQMRRQSHRRRGVSLLEALLAVSISATIFLVAIGWIHQSFKLAKAVKQKQQHHQQLMRLSDQFRQDVRLCQQVLHDADGRWVLQSEERGDVVYEVEGTVVSRVFRSTEATESHYEQYPLASGCTIRWDDTELPQWLTLIVDRSRGVSERTEPTPEETPVDLRVRAAVGRWRIPTAEEAGQ